MEQQGCLTGLCHNRLRGTTGRSPHIQCHNHRCTGGVIILHLVHHHINQLRVMTGRKAIMRSRPSRFLMRTLALMHVLESQPAYRGLKIRAAHRPPNASAEDYLSYIRESELQIDCAPSVWLPPNFFICMPISCIRHGSSSRQLARPNTSEYESCLYYAPIRLLHESPS